MSTLSKEAQSSLAHFRLCLSDIQKVLEAKDEAGNQPNHGAVALCLIVTESIAKICFPYVQVHDTKSRERRLGYKRRRTDDRSASSKNRRVFRQDTLEDVDLHYAVEKLWANYFSQNPKYSRYRKLIWDSYRNRIIHSYNVPNITGITGLKDRRNYFQFGTSIDNKNHLSFRIIDLDDGTKVPYMAFGAKQYSEDLQAAIEHIDREASSNHSLCLRLEIGYELHKRHSFIDFSGLPQNLQKVVRTDIQGASSVDHLS